MKPLLVFLGVSVMLAVLWWAWSAPTSLPALDGGEQSTTVALDANADRDAPVTLDRRRAPADGEPTDTSDLGVGSGETPPAPTPWRAHFVVVDEEDRPVPLATVTVKGVVFGDLPPRASRSEPIATLPTDANGRAELVTTEDELVVAAALGRDHRSRERRMVVGADAELRLVLERLPTVRGRVIGEGALPVVGARVMARITDGPSERGHVAPPDAVLSDAAGAFTFSLHDRVGYTLVAERDGRSTLPVRVFAPHEAHEAIELVFDGTFSVRGSVVGPRGEAVADATVSAWREWREGNGADHETVRARTGADGRFALSVRRCARYQLIASAPELANNEPVWVEPTLARPTIETVLRLSDLATIQGRVSGPDGAPLAGREVVATAADGAGRAPLDLRQPTGSALWGQPTSVTTGADGGFEIRVHPAVPCTVRVLPPAGGRLHVQRHGIAPGTRNLEIRCSADELAGGTIRGIVTRADGQPLGPIRLAMSRSDTPFASTKSVAVADDGSLAMGPFSWGDAVTLTVSLGSGQTAALSAPLAPATVGPIPIDASERTVRFHLQAWAELSVRVLAADGTAAEGASVSLRPEAIGFASPPRRVDAEGRIHCARVPPGLVRVWVHGVGEDWSTEVVLLPGTNPELTVRPPARR